MDLHPTMMKDDKVARIRCSEGVDGMTMMLVRRRTASGDEGGVLLLGEEEKVDTR